MKSKYSNKSRTGMPHTEETKQKMRKNSGQLGPKSHLWKGDRVGYKALHMWIERHFGKAKYHVCKKCGKSGPRMEWANVTGVYNREMLNWQTLCRKCHMKYDKEILGVKFGRPKKIS